MPHDQSRRVGFRDDIQGMRALAVLAIMVFHAGFSPYPGGFVTLDVFFVVSGFLITFLLLREVERDGTVSLLKFYSRRARRILPAATAVTIAVVTASALWLNATDARDAAFDGLWAALFGANIRFALQDTDYFDRADAPSPMQHYWSLSVEEQFYLVLPLVLVLCCVWARRRAASRGQEVWPTARRTIAWTLAIITALSFAWSVHASLTSPGTAYFSTFTRTWEFCAGGLVAVAAPRFSVLSRHARNLLAVAGVGAIVVACFVVDEQTPFPGWAALLPVLGTAAVMAAGAGFTGDRLPLAQRALGIAPLRWVGDASYSLYLWHWPLLTIASQHVRRDLTPSEIAGIIALTFVLSWASLRWVETPFRRWSPPRLPRTLVLYPASVALVLAGHAASTAWIDDQLHSDRPAIATTDYETGPRGQALSDDPAVALVEASTKAANLGRRIPGELQPPLVDLKKDKADLGDCDYAEGPWRLCPRGDTGADRSIVLLGNSHGRHWIPALERIAERAGYTAYYLVKSACTPARVQSAERKRDQHWEECTEFNQWAERQIRAIGPELVVITGSAPRAVIVDGEPVTSTDDLVPLMREGFKRVIEDVEPYADRVAVLADVPRRQLEPVDCLGRRGASLRDCLTTPKPSATRVVAASQEAARARGVDFIDTEPWFCAQGQCPAVVGGHISMRDNGHVTTAYAEHLAPALGRALGVWPEK